MFEPDDSPVGVPIDASNLGVSLAVVNEANEPIVGSPAITTRTDAYASTGSQVFARDVNFFNHFFRLRVDFDAAVSSVQINFTGSRPFAGDIGVLEAYASDGTFLQRYTTGGLLEHQYETMTVSASQPIISYVTAFTRREDGLFGRLDSVGDRRRRVTEAWTLTADDGAYSLPVRQAGTYRINQIVPDSFAQTLPIGDAGHDVTIAVGQTIGGVNFANASVDQRSWQNTGSPLDVDDDGFIAPIDALLIINELNEPMHRDPTTGLLPPPPPVVPAYFDVNGDGFVSAADAVLIINRLNQNENPAAAVPAEGEGEFDGTMPSDVASAILADGSTLVQSKNVVGGGQAEMPQALQQKASVEPQTVDSLFGGNTDQLVELFARGRRSR